MSFKLFKQTNAMDCGAFCLKMIFYYYGQDIDINWIRNYTNTNREGVSLFGIRYAAKKLGYQCITYRLPIEELNKIAQPGILHWNDKHFVVLYKTSKKRNNYTYHIADPGGSKLEVKQNILEKSWAVDGFGHVTLFVPPKKIITLEYSKPTNNLYYLFSKFKAFKAHWSGLGLSIITLLFLQILIPFLTQSIIDRGVNYQQINFVILVLSIQLLFFSLKLIIDFIRNIVLLKLSILVSLDIMSNYISKVVNLPIRFFHTKVIGDFRQRIADGQKIEDFLTYKVLDLVYSTLTVCIFLPILCYYSFFLALIFAVGSSIYLLWSYCFFEKRRKIDHLQFLANSTSQTSTIEIFQGIEEIKLNTCSSNKLSEWVKDRQKVFNIRLKGLFLEQVQNGGGLFISQCKSILILFYSIYLVINGQLTLGALLAITYISAQLETPLTSILNILRSYQDASLSLCRLDEVSKIEEENLNLDKQPSTMMKLDGDIILRNVCFKYDITSDENILHSLNFKIKKGEITAIVGGSGSGKTTLLRLLLGLYDPDYGEILVNNYNLKEIPKDIWRKKCGSVIQEGYIFSDTIANNITLSKELVNHSKIIQALDAASIYEFIQTLPLGLDTRIGEDGVKMSKGQLQRILLARAIYKSPHFLFLDEPTNSLDAINESEIIKKFREIYLGKTVLIIAHRFSTIKNANNIIVLDKGKIVEEGTHDQLFKQKGTYYDLFINQELTSNET